MDRAYFLKYYEFEKNHWWFRARAEILKDYIARHCSGPAPLKILNVGAATGGSIGWLSEFGHVTSIEFDKESVAFIKEQQVTDIFEGSILELQFPDSSFDLVCAFDVIEHVEDDSLAVRELARVCKEKGNVLITVPANRSLWSQHDIINHHFRRYSKELLMGLLNTLPSGKLTFITYFNYYFYFPISVVRKTTNFLSRLYRNRTLKSDFENFRPGVLNDFLFRIMVSEKGRVSSRRGYKRGVSILAHWVKE
ncbi:MAG: class I SAM-dependent methyltransferase [Bacteroidota bacterium]